MRAIQQCSIDLYRTAVTSSYCVSYRRLAIKLFIVSCAYLHQFLTLLSLCISFWFRITHCYIFAPTNDYNTSTGMIWVTLNMGRSAVNRQGNVMELSGNFTLSGECSAWMMITACLLAGCWRTVTDYVCSICHSVPALTQQVLQHGENSILTYRLNAASSPDLIQWLPRFVAVTRGMRISNSSGKTSPRYPYPSGLGT